MQIFNKYLLFIINKAEAMSKLKRSDVFDIINEERDYQDHFILKKVKTDEYTLSEWLMIIRKYVSDAENATINNDDMKILSSIRKVAALCVLMLEENGCVTRNNEQ